MAASKKFNGEDLVAKPDLVRMLECPICLDVSWPPIYNCPQGHSICGDCRKKLTKCGSCKLNFIESRNFALESIVNGSYFDCKYKDEGCEQNFVGASFKEHAKKCDFRPVVCAMLCGEEISYADYVNHLQTSHDVSLIPASTTSGQRIFRRNEYSDNSDGARKVTLIQFDNQYFSTNRHRRNGMMYRWISFIGNASEASKYQGAISIIGKQQDVGITELQWKFNIPSFILGFEEILKSGRYPCISIDQFTLFARNNVKSKAGNMYNYHWLIEYAISKLTTE